jgi:hypothetical protein
MKSEFRSAENAVRHSQFIIRHFPVGLDVGAADGWEREKEE